MSGDVRICDIQPGRAAEGVYAVVRKQRRHDRNGDPYLVLELSDSTGRIAGKIWRNADWFDRNVREGDRVRTVGRGAMFREQLELEIRRMDPVDHEAGAATEAFIPAARRSVEDMAGELDFLASEIAHPQLRALVAAVWSGPHRDGLLRSPATARDHHAYLGGLVEHSIAVATICMAAADRHDRLDRDLLLAAALLHDVGRMRELRTDETLGTDQAGGLVGHVLLGHELLLEAAGGTAPDAPWWPRLVHAVSAHHGPADRCHTLEALTLMSANMLDARLAARER